MHASTNGYHRHASCTAICHKIGKKTSYSRAIKVHIIIIIIIITDLYSAFRSEDTEALGKTGLFG